MPEGVIHTTDFVAEAKRLLPSSSKASGLTTGKVRSVSSALFRTLPDKSIATVLDVCERLLSTREWPLGVIAYDWAYRVRNQYDVQVFYTFERWLKEYVTDWGPCDDLCTHAFGALLAQNNDYFSRILEWTEHPAFPVRRASALVLIYPIKHGKYAGIDPFKVSDILMNDEHDLVLKGYGWMLKVLSEREPDRVYQYLRVNEKRMPRVAFRYALEKLDESMKMSLMSSKRPFQDSIQ